MKKGIHIYIMAVVITLCMACTSKSSKQSIHNETNVATTSDTTNMPVVLLDTTGTVKGYQTQQYTIPVTTEGQYTITASSPNTGFIFVLQDANKNNIMDETYPTWTGVLKKGDYTLIVGLMRNSARNTQKEVNYTINVKRDSCNSTIR